MKKFRLFIDYEKEEKWLNAMATKGWALKSALFTYTFRKTPPEDTAIRVDFRIFKHKKDYADYIALFEDSGWQHIAGYKSIGIHYFKKNREQANEDIFSDAASKASRYKRASQMWLMFFICCIPIILSLYINTILVPIAVQHALPHHGLLIDLKFIFDHPYLPWQHFLFENHFVLMGMILICLAILLQFTCLILALQCRSFYKKQMHH